MLVLHGTKRSADKPDRTVVGALAGLKALEHSTQTAHAATHHSIAVSPYCQINVNGPFLPFVTYYQCCGAARHR